MRGLKHLCDERVNGEQVASFTDAWIETSLYVSVINKGAESHLLQMRGLKRYRRA